MRLASQKDVNSSASLVSCFSGRPTTTTLLSRRLMSSMVLTTHDLQAGWQVLRRQLHPLCVVIFFNSVDVVANLFNCAVQLCYLFRDCALAY